MSDGITDAYRAEREHRDATECLKARLKEQKAEMLYYKASKVNELTRNLGTGYQSVRRKMHSSEVDLVRLFSDYLKQLKDVLDLPDTIPAGQEMVWYSDMCWLKMKKHSLK